MAFAKIDRDVLASEYVHRFPNKAWRIWWLDVESLSKDKILTNPGRLNLITQLLKKKMSGSEGHTLGETHHIAGIDSVGRGTLDAGSCAQCQSAKK